MEEVRHTTVLDTGHQHLGMVYAKALLGATEKAGNTDQVVAELNALVDDVLGKLPQFEALLASPRIPFEAKEQALDRALQGKMSGQLLNFLKVLTRRGRFDTLRAVQLAAKMLLNKLRGRVEVQLTTAEPLDKGTTDLIIAKLQSQLGRKVDLQISVDPELIGGLVIRTGDTVFDGSVANQLRQLRKELVFRATQTMRSHGERFSVAN